MYFILVLLYILHYEFCQARGRKFNFSAEKLRQTIVLFGLPPKKCRGSLVAPGGYWVVIARNVNDILKVVLGGGVVETPIGF